MNSSTWRAILGGGVSIAFCAVAGARPQNDLWVHALVVLAASTLVPLALELLAERNDAKRAAQWLGWGRLGALPSAVLLAIACALPRGLLAALLTLPWVALTFLLASAGVLRGTRHGFARPLDRLCGDAGLIFSAIGGLWLLADRLVAGVFGFDATIVALTAAHFHYAGFLLPIFTGQAVRRLPESRFAARVAVGVVLGVPGVAVGITATRLGLGPAIETAAGAGLAIAGALVAVFHVRLATEKTLPNTSRALLGVAGVALFFGMTLAALYAVRPFLGLAPWLGLPQMRALHGTINALGFGLCGVLGWRAAGAGRPGA